MSFLTSDFLHIFLRNKHELVHVERKVKFTVPTDPHPHYYTNNCFSLIIISLVNCKPAFPAIHQTYPQRNDDYEGN